MPTNPYVPPKEINDRREPIKVNWWQGMLLKLLALGLWFLALAHVAIGFDVLSRPENVPRRVRDPGLFWITALVVFGLPIISLVSFGIASWRRSKPFAYAGLGAIGLIVLYVLCISLIPIIRRWIAD